MSELDTLNQHAAIAARDGVECGIAGIEARIKIKMDDINEAAKEYFAAGLKSDKAALEQLKSLRASLNRRVFDAYRAENL